MLKSYASKISLLLNLTSKQVLSTLELLAEGGTVPFIARYRKEVTGLLDEVEIAAIRDLLADLQELDKRRESIINSLKEREILTDELLMKINNSDNLSTLEDIYLPYKIKRKTRATVARDKGLEPLAELIVKQQNGVDIDSEAKQYIDAEKGVNSLEDALQGARDILSEIINEDANVRERMRQLFIEKAMINSCATKPKKKDNIDKFTEESQKFKDYFAWNELALSVPSHRLLAMFRGEKDGFLKLSIQPNKDDALTIIRLIYCKNKNKLSAQVDLAIIDAYSRLLAPSMENEIKRLCKGRADDEAIRVFSGNIRDLLMAAPLGQKRVLAIDPGFRTGCKAVVLNEQGKIVEHTVLFMTSSTKGKKEAEIKLKEFCAKYKIEAIAIGSGTASRESESFIKSLTLLGSPLILIVNESGASIYSASKTAREEFPDYDLTVRGAISIGRRLMDPLSELIKIDPKSIGVGQYQHDVEQAKLKRCLDDVVVSCVNAVGVEVNTASKELLTYVSGLGGQIAENIVKYRNENGAFKSRAELKKVTRLGPKAFQQAAGFLRIQGAKNPLDVSAVHPERYSIVKQMAGDKDCSISDLIKNSELRESIDINKYVTVEVGFPTLTDIITELAKPGRDPRKVFEEFSFAEGIEKISDLKSGMKLPGIVTNVTKFGAFVDIGVHQDGLVHISQLANTYVKDPIDIVRVMQKVSVTVIDIDVERNRISLSMTGNISDNIDHSKNLKSKTGIEHRKKRNTVSKKETGGGNWLRKAIEF